MMMIALVWIAVMMMIALVWIAVMMMIALVDEGDFRDDRMTGVGIFSWVGFETESFEF